MRVIVATCLVAVVAGHGLMNFPPSRVSNSMKTAGTCHGEHPEHIPQSGTCLWFNQGCQPGCNTCNENCTGFFGGGFAKCCGNPMEPTVTDKKLWTFPQIGGLVDITKHNPWRSPGFAPVFDPCGVAGGAYQLRKPDPSWYPPPRNSGKPPVGIELGTSGQDLPELDGINTEWPAGSQQEVSWNIVANHGGGYAYRLCPKLNRATEECFQSHHLQFVGNSSWIQYGDNKYNRTAIPATRVSVGTNPLGSEWTKNPIPACSGMFGGAGVQPGCSTPQFQPPLTDVIPAHENYAPTPGLYGFGKARCTRTSCSEDEHNFWETRFNFNIIDQVQVPADLPTGDYLLSFRWDSEQNSQVWANCADITIVAPPMMV